MWDSLRFLCFLSPLAWWLHPALRLSSDVLGEDGVGLPHDKRVKGCSDWRVVFPNLQFFLIWKKKSPHKNIFKVFEGFIYPQVPLWPDWPRLSGVGFTCHLILLTVLTGSNPRGNWSLEKLGDMYKGTYVVRYAADVGVRFFSEPPIVCSFQQKGQRCPSA